MQAVALRPVALVAMCLLAALAGCSSPAVEPQDAAPAPADLAALADGLPCEAPFSDQETTENLRRVSLTGFDSGGGPQEMDVRGGLLLAARLEGFTTVDVSDPAHPRELGHYGDAGGMLDVKFSPDNLTALVGAYENVDLVDIRDPADPVRVGRWEFAGEASPPSGLPGQNAHMLIPARIAGQDWVFLAPQSSSGVWVLRMDGTPDARSLSLVTTTLPVQGGASGPHDIFLQHDEVLGTWVLYTADAFAGWTAFDVGDPANPQVLVAVPNADVSGTHSVHAARIGERRIVVTSTEFGMNALKVWDATNLQAPIQVGYWTRKLGPEVYEHQHNLNVVEGRLYMAHYAQGLFVFDLTTLPATPAGLLDIQPVAHYAGSQRSVLGSGSEGGFWDVVVHEGLLYAGAYSGGHEEGLHVVAYGCITPGDPVFTSAG